MDEADALTTILYIFYMNYKAMQPIKKQAPCRLTVRSAQYHFAIPALVLLYIHASFVRGVTRNQPILYMR